MTRFTMKFVVSLVAGFAPLCIVYELLKTVRLERGYGGNVTTMISEKQCDYLPFDVHNSSKYVSLCADRMLTNVNGNGNHLFFLAALVYVAEKTGRSILVDPNVWCLDKIFQLGCLSRYNGSHSTIPGPHNMMHWFGNRWMSLDERFTKKNASGVTVIETYQEKTILLCGSYQTSIYADAVSHTLRRLLQLRPDVKTAADEFIRAVRPTTWTQSPVADATIGVHVRRGDFLDEGHRRHGLTVITEEYLHNAMQYFISRHRRVQFLIVSNGQKWVESAVYRLFPSSRPASGRSGAYQTIVVNENIIVTQSLNNSAAIDMAILTLCDGVIVSTGSFGWWAAWIANKPTVYYADWPRNYSDLASVYDREAYFPKSWIPLR